VNSLNANGLDFAAARHARIKSRGFRQKARGSRLEALERIVTSQQWMPFNVGRSDADIGISDLGTPG
jgi:hypothetical protein